MATKEYSTFSKSPRLSYLGHSLAGGGVLPLCRGVVGVFYCSSRLGFTDLRTKIETGLDPKEFSPNKAKSFEKKEEKSKLGVRCL